MAREKAFKPQKLTSVETVWQYSIFPINFTQTKFSKIPKIKITLCTTISQLTLRTAVIVCPTFP